MVGSSSASRPSRKGMPLKPEAARKRHNLGFRVNDEVRERLQRCADAGQRSLSEEIEFQLQRYDDLDLLFGVFLRDEPSRELFRTLAVTLKAVRGRARARSFSEKETRIALKAAFNFYEHILFWDGTEGQRAPAGVYEEGKNLSNYSPEALGYAIASNLWTAGGAFDEKGIAADFPHVITDYWSGDGTKSEPAGEALEKTKPEATLAKLPEKKKPVSRKSS